jgi:hypothetical protein
MTNAQAMLDTYPRTFNVDAQLLAATIDVIVDCASTCTQCADACLSERNAGELAKCIRLNLDCADVCTTTARVVSRQTDYDANVTRAVLDACIATCRSCGDECSQHADHMAHCDICSRACRRCEQACRDLLGAIS